MKNENVINITPIKKVIINKLLVGCFEINKLDIFHIPINENIGKIIESNSTLEKYQYKQDIMHIMPIDKIGIVIKTKINILKEKFTQNP